MAKDIHSELHIEPTDYTGNPEDRYKGRCSCGELVGRNISREALKYHHECHRAEQRGK